ncbi:MAG: YiiX/YebB-like N1pC/P60 family cysteine hydrolase [Desulfotignum sp.]|nr:YiiX/YebB-like N1pC/P60 family cysteine hydrolase [Desulfotignum sp.]
MKSIISMLRKLILSKLEKQQHRYEQRGYNNLEKLYKVIRPGDVILVEGRSEMSRLIKLFTGSQWSHCAMYVGNALVGGAGAAQNALVEKYGEDARHLMVEAFSGQGVIAAALKKYEHHNIRICRPFGILETDLKQVIDQVTGKLGMHYDDQNILAIAAMALQAIFRPLNKLSLKACLGNCNDYQVICSGMLAQAFQHVGYPIVPAMTPRTYKSSRKAQAAYDDTNPYGGGLIMRHYTQITPGDFDLSPNFEIIKYNILGNVSFDYKSLWVEKL